MSQGDTDLHLPHHYQILGSSSGSLLLLFGGSGSLLLGSGGLFLGGSGSLLLRGGLLFLFCSGSLLLLFLHKCISAIVTPSLLICIA